jgi:catechol 2,3-dioxygenase-like lactoylglutathione lyase family enzyme
MRRFAVATLTLVLCTVVARADDKHPRPKILGIAGVHFYSTDLPAARKFYSIVFAKDLTCSTCEKHGTDGISALLPSRQIVVFTPPPQGATPSNLLAEVVFATDNIQAMEAYLEANEINFSKPASHLGVGVVPELGHDSKDADLLATDPDGHRIGFMQVRKNWSPSNTDALRVIHAGFVVHDRAAEDHFYKDILGFHLYWHGGMKDDVDNWVAMQVPDGTDWVEYMLNVGANASKHTLGVMNHIALGVTDIHETQKKLIANGAKLAEEPKVGRDGKWQLNLYDPDETRTEFMEFAPKEKPCCSEFTGTHPGPK